MTPVLITENISSLILPDGWKWRLRTRPPTLVILHATRSGRNWSMAKEYESTKNWFLSPTNRLPGRHGDYAAMACYIVGGGKVCRVLPETHYAAYSLGHADPSGISIEICQPKVNTPFLREDLENAAALCRGFSEEYDIPVRVLPFLSGDNHEAPGYVRHDRSAQGERAGKSDPGPEFNDREFEAMVRGDDDMLSEENRKRLDRQAVLLMLAAMNGADAPATPGQKALGRGVIETMKDAPPVG